MPTGIYKHGPLSEETKKKIRENSPHYWKGKKRSEDNKKKLSDKARTPERISISIQNLPKDVRGEKNPFYGKKHSKEFSLSRTGEKHPLWKGGLRDCILCGDKLISYNAEMHRRCRTIFSVGERHHRWKGGNCKKKDERNDSLYQRWKADILKRDKKCMLEDKHCLGYRTVHHILGWTAFPEFRYDLNNGIVLCQGHHPRKRADEQRLIPILQELVGSYTQQL